MTLRTVSVLLGAALACGSVLAQSTATATSPPTPAAAPAFDAATAGTGRALSRQFLDGDTAAVWARFSPQMQTAMQDPAALAQFRAQVAAQLGDETAVEREDTQSQDGARVYVRIARWSKAEAPIRMQWAFDDTDQVVGFFIRPDQAQARVPAASPHLAHQTRADLRLPFEDDWFVFWGGRTVEQNYHSVNAGQRFAYDFVKRVDGRTHRGEGRALDDYYCWDAPILAPAAGRVVAVVSDQPDQAIGTTNAAAPAGNHVVLDLGHDEYALLGHLRAGSVQVKWGDTVARGTELGRCGNSGNTSEPHLHMHLQDAATFGSGHGLPAFFNDYIADGKPVPRGEPVRGQTIRAR